jgi:starch phosphorylase
MYDLIEHQVAPRFYERGADGVPTRWMASVRHTLATLSPELSADRMVKEYVERLYIPASHAAREITAEGNRPARELAAWKSRVIAAWPKVHVTHVESGGVDAAPQVGDELHVRAHVDLDGLSPDDVSVDVVYGRAWDSDTMTDVQLAPLELASAEPGQSATFAGTVELARAGSFGYTVRVTPRHVLLASPAELGLVTTAV